MIVTANHYFSPRYPTWDRWFRHVVLRRLGQVGVRFAGESTLGPIHAVANHGAWIVRCPDPGCRGAEMAWEEGLMMCLSCFNAAAGHRLLRTRFPRARHEIERLLDRRPLPNRNWEPGETLAFLRRENEEHAKELI